jgi:Uma2 family endonuclease
VLELAVDGSVIAMTPTGSETGARNSKFLFQLKLYANRVGRWKVFDSSSGFWLPDGSVVSPDTSLVRLDRWQALSTAERRSFVPLCPGLGGRTRQHQRRRALGLERLASEDGFLFRPTAPGWVGCCCPSSRSWRCEAASGGPKRLEQIDVLEATADVPGLQLQLAEIWAG